MNDPIPIRGILLMLGSSIAFCVMAALVRYASYIEASRVVLFRFVIGLGLLGAAALFGKIRLQFVDGKLLILRGLVGGASVFLFYLSIAKLGLGKGTVIVHSYPAFAAILGRIILKERVSFGKAVAVAVAICGVGLMTVGKNGLSSLLDSAGLYELLAVLGAVAMALAMVLIKKLHSTDSTYTIYFAQCVIGLWMVFIPANTGGGTIGYGGAAILLCIGIAAAAGQLLLTEGFRYVPVLVGSLMDMLFPVLSLLTGIVVFHERLSVLESVGAAVIVLSCATVIVNNRRTPMRTIV
jgi:drug/metabolite transporter (DMT)-like permease